MTFFFIICTHAKWQETISFAHKNSEHKPQKQQQPWVKSNRYFCRHQENNTVSLRSERETLHRLFGESYALSLDHIWASQNVGKVQKNYLSRQTAAKRSTFQNIIRQLALVSKSVFFQIPHPGLLALGLVL